MNTATGRVQILICWAPHCAINLFTQGKCPALIFFLSWPASYKSLMKLWHYFSTFTQNLLGCKVTWYWNFTIYNTLLNTPGFWIVAWLTWLFMYLSQSHASLWKASQTNDVFCFVAIYVMNHVKWRAIISLFPPKPLGTTLFRKQIKQMSFITEITVCAWIFTIHWPTVSLLKVRMHYLGFCIYLWCLAHCRTNTICFLEKNIIFMDFLDVKVAGTDVM